MNDADDAAVYLARAVLILAPRGRVDFTYHDDQGVFQVLRLDEARGVALGILKGDD